MPTQDSSRGGPSHLTMCLKTEESDVKVPHKHRPTFPSYAGYRRVTLHRTIRTRKHEAHRRRQRAGRKRALQFQGRPSRMRPVAGHELTAATPWNRLPQSSPARLCFVRAKSMHTKMHASDEPGRHCARPASSEEKKGHGHSLERPLRERFGGSKWVSIAICLPGITISSR